MDHTSDDSSSSTPLPPPSAWPPSEPWEPSRKPCTLKDLAECDRFGFLPLALKDCPSMIKKRLLTSDPPCYDHPAVPDACFTLRGQEAIGWRCERLLEHIVDIWTQYEEQCPNKVSLSPAEVLRPQGDGGGGHHLVDDGGQDPALSATMRSVNAILEKAEVAHQWWEMNLNEDTTLKDPVCRTRGFREVRVWSRRALLETFPTVVPLGSRLADWYILYDSTVIIATIKSEPHFTPREVIELVNRYARGSNPSWHDELLVQLASQGLAGNAAAAVSPLGLLIGNGGKFLLPFQAIRRDEHQSRLLFASEAFYCDVEYGSHAASESYEAFRRTTSRPSLNGSSNMIMMIMAFALTSYGDYIRPIRQREKKAEKRVAKAAAKAAGLEYVDEEQEASSSSASAFDSTSSSENDSDEEMSSSTTTTTTSSSSSPGSATQHRYPTRRLVARQKEKAPLAVPILNRYACAGRGSDHGLHAALFHCVFRDNHLKRAKQSLPHTIDRRERLRTKVIEMRYASNFYPGETHALMKVQVMPQEEGWGLPRDPESRLEDIDNAEYTIPDEEERFKMRGRIEQEFTILHHCKTLQGIVIPRLYGIVSAKDLPESSADKLMLQELFHAQTLKDVNDKLIFLWQDEIANGIRKAYQSLHRLRVWHHSIKSSSVLIDFRSSIEQERYSNGRRIIPGPRRSELGGRSHTETWKFDGILSHYDVILKLTEILVDLGRRPNDARMACANEKRSARPNPHVQRMDPPLSWVELKSDPLVQALRESIKPHIWIVGFSQSRVVPVSEGDDVFVEQTETLEREIIMKEVYDINPDVHWSQRKHEQQQQQLKMRNEDRSQERHQAHKRD